MAMSGTRAVTDTEVVLLLASPSFVAPVVICVFTVPSPAASDNGVPETGQVTFAPAGTALPEFQVVPGVGGDIVHWPTLTLGGKFATPQIAAVAVVAPWFVHENEPEYGWPIA